MTETTTIRDQIVTNYQAIAERLDARRARRLQLNAEIAELVAELREQRKLVRVVAPELLSTEANGE
jgi:hypothetical protein